MAELARGQVTDRPWGKTLAALGLRGLTGQLTLTADGKRYEIAFAEGAVVGAASPLVADAAVRVALTSGLVSSTQVADIARRQAAAPDRDEIEVIAELARLTPDQALRLRRRVVAQRAARTFAIDRGELVVEDRVTVPVAAGTEMDIRGVIYLGARQHLSEARLGSELAVFGTAFRLKADAVEDLPQFGFGDAERPLLERLKTGIALAELASLGLDPRLARAALYALAACGALDTEVARPAAEVKRPATSSTSPPTTLRRRAPTAQPAPQRRRADSAQAADVQRLVDQRMALLKRGASHFELLGVMPDVTPEDLRKAYFALARQLHPDKLNALGITDESKRAQRLFAAVNAAFTELSDPVRRAAYVDILQRGGAKAIAAEQAKAEELAARVVAAEEAFRRGEAALRRDQLTVATRELAQAMALNPEEADYIALHAWAQFCASADKVAVGSATKAALERALQKSPRAIAPRFYLGRVERMLGRDQQALQHFREVLAEQPHHTEAGSEVRTIEARLAAAGESKGLFGRSKR